jgi:hypothetical protein
MQNLGGYKVNRQFGYFLERASARPSFERNLIAAIDSEP